MRKQTVLITDFVSYLPAHTYIFLPTREPWPAGSVNSQLAPMAVLDKNGKPMLDDDGKPLRIKASLWLDIHRPVQQMTWAPGEEMIIKDRLCAEGGWFDKPNMTCLNLYRPPKIELGDARKAKPWLDHVRKIYPNDADHIIKFLAHRVQRPGDKINHALFLGGEQGIGKDTLLEPAKHAVGAWNFQEVSPVEVLGRFNGFRKSVILRVSEARDLGESNRFAAYDHMKTLCAAPPDTLRVDEKNLREHYIINCCGVITTSNYKTDGMYLPSDDRRTYVAWSELTKEDFTDAYWKTLWKWYESGGIEHVAAYLAKLDISKFDAKAPPPKTPAFWAIVDANRAPEEAELEDIFDELGKKPDSDKIERPDAVTLDDIIDHASDLNFTQWLEDRKNRRVIPHRLERVGYVPVRNETSKQGLWVIDGTRQVVYVKSTLPLREQFRAAEKLRREREKKVAEAKKKAAEEAAARKKGNGKRQPHF
jgi:Family of unknown function (DUF5906)